MDKILTIIEVLKNLGYTPEVKQVRCYYFISFLCFGYSAFPKSHKDVIRTLAGDRLVEFYYRGCNTQYICLRGDSK
jgi:hypothetical protein